MRQLTAFPNLLKAQVVQETGGGDHELDPVSASERARSVCLGAKPHISMPEDSVCR
jgi:hypothetical protein